MTSLVFVSPDYLFSNFSKIESPRGIVKPLVTALLPQVLIQEV